MTTKTIEAAGYIVVDKEGLIYGCGSTAAGAWQEAEETLRQASIKLLSDDDDSTEELGSWTRASGFETWPASAALITQADEAGGAIGWRSVDGVAVTKREVGV